MTFEQMWRDLAPVGRSAASGGYFRQPWTSAETELRAWFAEEARRRGLRLVVDAVGNQVAWWDVEVGDDEAGGADGGVVPDVLTTDRPGIGSERQGLSGRGPERQGLPHPGPAARPSDGVLTGSHLDSVLDGGAYDGPLGVVSAFAALDVLRERGFRPARPLGVAAFVEEEGSRFGRACLGSRLAVGATTWADVRELRDREGVALPDALVAAGLDPTALERGDGPVSTGGVLHGVGAYVELHVEQGRDLVHRDVPVGLGSMIWPHGRWRFDFTGEANHAGTTRMEDRRNPMLTYAMTVLAADKQARLADLRATFGRVEAVPNGVNAVPSRVSAWLDARGADDGAVRALVDTIERQASERAERDGTAVTVTAESVTDPVHFDADLTARIDAAISGGGLPVIPTGAGHDAGVLAQAGMPTAMLHVRNPTGVSHAPGEHAETADCLAGVEALADSLAHLTRGAAG